MLVARLHGIDWNCVKGVLEREEKHGGHDRIRRVSTVHLEGVQLKTGGSGSFHFWSLPDPRPTLTRG